MKQHFFIKRLDIYFIYLAISLASFTLFWATNNPTYVLVSRILLTICIFLFFTNVFYLAKTNIGKVYITIFIIFGIYYTIFGYSLGNLWLIYKPLLTNIYFNFLLGFAISYQILRNPDQKINFYLYSTMILLIFVAAVILIQEEPYFMVSSRINLYQTLSDYLLRILIFCTFLTLLKDPSRKSFLLILWTLGLLISLFSGAKKQLFIEFIMISYFAISLFQGAKFLKKSLITLFAFTGIFFLSFELVQELSKFEINGINFERLLETIEVSFFGRVLIIQDNFIRFLDATNFIGNPFIHEVVGGIYIHSLPLSLITSYGIFFGVLIFSVIFFSIFQTIKTDLHHFLLGISILAVSVIATYYDWLVLWYFLGILCGQTAMNIIRNEK